MRHPTKVDEQENIRKKFKLKQRTDKYLFAFDPANYCDIEIFNITREKTTIYPGLCAALQYSEIPVVFNLSYDVGYKETIDVFVRHVVCCLAVGTDIYFFDMRNLREISNETKVVLEREIENACHKKFTLINISCLERSTCLRLQRYLAPTDIGWCIAWALLFMDYLSSHPEITEMTSKEKTKKFAAFYRHLDAQLKKHHNAFIEDYYQKLSD
jgi:hypothetical protein